MVLSAFSNVAGQSAGGDRDSTLTLDQISVRQQVSAAALIRDDDSFFERLSFFSPIATKHFNDSGYDYNELNLGVMLGVELNKNRNSAVSTTAYAGFFNNSFGDISPTLNLAFETRRGIGLFGQKDALGVGVALMASHYPGRKEFLTGGPVPYLSIRMGGGVNTHIGYIALNDNKPSLSGGTMVLSFAANLSETFKWAKKATKRMKSRVVQNSNVKKVGHLFQPMAH